MFRERLSAFLAIGVALLIPVAVFFAIYIPQMARDFPFMPGGSYPTDMFGAKNLPFQVAGMFFGRIGDGSPATLPFDLAAWGLFALLLLAVALIFRRLLTRTN